MPKTKTIAKLKQDVQKVFNMYIRLRDKDKPCISCGKYVEKQAGHFFPVSTHDGIRFDEHNVSGECSRCNCFDEGHLIGYAINLKERIGQERFDALFERAAEYKKNGWKWSRQELIELKQKYTTKIKQL
jgi:hypothetical protein